MQLGEAFVRDFQLDAARRVDLDEIHEFPRDHLLRDFAQQGAESGAGNQAFEKAADGAARADVHGGELDGKLVVAEVLVKVNVVDADDFAAVDINDLLVEEITLQQQQTLGAGKGGPFGGPGARLDDAVDGVNLGDAEQAVPAGTGADDQAGEADGIVLGRERDLAHTSGECAGGVENRRFQELGKGEGGRKIRLQAAGVRLQDVCRLVGLSVVRCKPSTNLRIPKGRSGIQHRVHEDGKFVTCVPANEPGLKSCSNHVEARRAPSLCPRQVPPGATGQGKVRQGFALTFLVRKGKLPNSWNEAAAGVGRSDGLGSCKLCRPPCGSPTEWTRPWRA